MDDDDDELNFRFSAQRLAMAPLGGGSKFSASQYHTYSLKYESSLIILAYIAAVEEGRPQIAQGKRYLSMLVDGILMKVQ